MPPSARWLARHLARRNETIQPHSKLVVGLGNPGIRYARNRHNVGFMVVDRFVRAHDLSFSRRRFDALLADGEVEGNRVLLCKPQTYMNDSGKAVGKLAAFFRVDRRDIIVCYDDLDLPFGRIRLRPGGSAGGHHGMESIISALGHSDFARLRIGIGRPDPEADIGHVLGNFSEEEEQELNSVLTRAAQALDVWLTAGIDQAMNKYNS